jgi:hypothetical protein
MDEGQKRAVLAASRAMLRPIVRLLLKTGVTFKEFAEVAKAGFVQVATEDFGIRGRPTNAARVAILTGINRREVARQRELNAAIETQEPIYVSSATRLLTGWHVDADYIDASGAPRKIAPTGPAPSFEDLCSRYAGDMPATALRKELKTVGAIRETADGELQVLQRSYMPMQVDVQKTLIGGELMRTLAHTVVHDLTAPANTPLRYARFATNARVDVRHAEEFRQLLHKEGQAFLERVDEWLSRHELPNAEPNDRNVVRLGVGVYHVQDDPKREISK